MRSATLLLLLSGMASLHCATGLDLGGDEPGLAGSRCDGHCAAGLSCVDNVCSPNATDSVDAGISAPNADGGPDVNFPTGWRDMATPAQLAGRTNHTVVWTGSEMIVWGGDSSDFGAACQDGARYNPSTDSWVLLPTAPIAGRFKHTAVWTGSQMVVWGGFASNSERTGDGAIYDPATNQWTRLSEGPTARSGHTATWTGREMIVWGGYGPVGAVNDGMRWKPVPAGSGGTWSPMAASPLSARFDTRAVWTGAKLVIFGGRGDAEPYRGDAASYDPVTDTWVTLSPPSALDARTAHAGVATGANGGLATFFEGWGPLDGSPGLSSNRGNGATYDPVASSWTLVPAPSSTILTPPGRGLAFVWWGAGKLWTWGGQAIVSGFVASDGASYDPTTSAWIAMPAGGPSARLQGTVVWTGSEAILWGGTNDAPKNDGKIYRP